MRWSERPPAVRSHFSSPQPVRSDPRALSVAVAHLVLVRPGAFFVFRFLRPKPKKTVIRSPRLGVLNLKGDTASHLVTEDRAAIENLFSSVQESTSVAPKCDVLLAYCDLAVEGRVSGSSKSLREIIRDSGAVVVVLASENAQEGILAATKEVGYGHANLAVTLDRKGNVFSSFYGRLFGAMAEGETMPVAWVQLAPQIPGSEHSDCPAGFFVCEAGQIAFA
jgi:hypothetical protein